jgi:membrane-bound lytic murein transglycosylase D
MKKHFLVFILLCGMLDALCQDISSNDFEYMNSSITDDTFFVPESWDVNLDSMMNSQYVKYYIDKNAHPGYSEAVIASDSVYVDRLSRLNNIIELPYNRVVRNCIDLYVDRRRNIVEYMLGLENFYFPMIEQALDENDLPHELKYLAVIESALNPVALSRVGASGLWQFMLATGKQYGLEINSLVDERRDPLKATYAACEYFKDMYRIYGDWTLVIAAYNCGSGNVNKAIRRAGSTDYWKIYPFLPRETRLYVPLFIAATYVMNYYANHQLRPVQTNLPIAVDTVMVNQAIHFDQVAEILNVDKELIRMLNPQYKRDIIPGNSKPRVLKLPALHAYAFVEKENTIINHRKDELFANRTYAGSTGSNREKIIHKVKTGETAVSIGNKYGVTAASIRKWNKLKSNRIGAGRKIIVYIDNGGYAGKSSPAPPNANAKPNVATASLNKPEHYKTAGSLNKYDTYKVRSGDSLYSIAQKYPGYSLDDLKKINNLKGSQLKIGQVIKVPKG